MAAPLAEMMFYEAAEEAVQDSYATIIPDDPEGKKANVDDDVRSEKTEQNSASSEAEPHNQKE